MRRWIQSVGAVLLAGALAMGSGLPARAQEDAVERIRAAYNAYEAWDTYQIQVDDAMRSALVVEGPEYSLVQRRQREATITGWYDVTDRDSPLVWLALTGELDESSDQNGEILPGGWSLDMEVAAQGGAMFWRGEYEAEPEPDVALPDDWEPVTVRDMDALPALVDVALGSYVQDGGTGPLVDGVERWLDAALSIEGPEPYTVNRTTSGDLYTVEVNLAAVPELVADHFRWLTEGPDAVVDQDVLLDALIADGTLTWRVLVDPDTGGLLLQYLTLDLSANLGQGDLLAAYTSLTLAFSGERGVLFGGINGPVDTAVLPE
ncbi:MAG: hypothetical protein JXJ20_07915 [Anaerolineae bacterium]|nr:hypothetical protein [Anaerolineae bacterium]